MSVLPGEGTHPILYRSARLVAGTRIHAGYLARPDLRGSYPTIVVVHAMHGVTSGVKDLCRRMARHGFAVVAPDLYRGSGPNPAASENETQAAYDGLSDRRALADLGDVLRFVQGPGTGWSDPDRLGVFGMGHGGRWALLAAADHDVVRAVCVSYPAVSDEEGRSRNVLDGLAGVTIPLLGLSGRTDEVSGADVVSAVRRAKPDAEWIIYEDAGHDFLDDSRGGYQRSPAGDALERIVAFFRRELAEASESAVVGH